LVSKCLSSYRIRGNLEKLDKQFAVKGERAPYYFYRSHAGLEVDLLLDHGDGFDAYEIKFSATPKKEMVQSLLQFQSEYTVKKSALLTLRREKSRFTNDVEALHWSED